MKIYNLKYRLCILLTLIFCFTYTLSAQVAINDNCNQSLDIPIINGGYGIGMYISDTIDLTNTTVENNEYIPPALNNLTLNHKSVWYKFTTATNRSVRVSLKQPSVMIGAGNVGFAVYKTNSCYPNASQLSTKLTPLSTFGSSFHPCLEAGTYYIQVVGNYMAEGQIYIQLDLSATGADYDNRLQPGKLAIGPLVEGHNLLQYNVDCQGIENINELCVNSKFPSSINFNKTVWHTFSTPSYFDVIDILLSKNSSTGSSNLNNIVGFSLYEGDVSTTPTANLISVIDCDTLRLNARNAAIRSFKCGQLNPNRTYTLKLIFSEAFVDQVKLSAHLKGKQATKSPIPILSSIHIDNVLGVLDNSNITRVDYLGCNSKFLNNNLQCSLLPTNGVLINGIQYDLSTFFTFKLNNAQNVSLNLDNWNACNNKVIRLFKSSVTNTCNNLDTNNFVAILNSSNKLNCLPEGDYIIQVLGSSSKSGNYTFQNTNQATAYCNNGHLGDEFILNILTEKVQTNNNFNLVSTNRFNAINQGLPLVHGNLYPGIKDTFGCDHTVLPVGSNSCGIYQKAIYRQFELSDSGLVQFKDLNEQFIGSKRVQYVLYKGNASALSTSQNVHVYPQIISGLQKLSACISSNQISNNEACLTAGTYTLVALADSNMVNWSDSVKVQYNRDVRSNALSPQSSTNLGDIINLIGSNNSYLSNLDTFSCLNNAVAINGVPICGAKAIYREFYLSQSKMVKIATLNNYTNLQLFKGRASVSLNSLNLVWSCFKSRETENCQELESGWYTIVDYADGVSYSNNNFTTNSQTGDHSQITIEIKTLCPSTPKYNRPHLASYNVNNQPHIITWDTLIPNNAVIENTQKTYILPTEIFACPVDTGYVNKGFFACDTTKVKIAFYVIEIKKESYLKIDQLMVTAALYRGDVRLDSLGIANSTPLQTCINNTSSIEICNIQPGYYTLVLYATNEDLCLSVSPKLIVDKVGQSRFDHAINAYDFGLLPGNNVFISGKQGDVNPINPARAASNDIFYCKTGAAEADPLDAVCNTAFNSRVYGGSATNNVMFTAQDSFVPVRRNLWYTFQTNNSGIVTVKIDSKRTGQTTNNFNVAIYRSDVDPLLPFNTIVQSNLVDSTILQGLTLVTTNMNMSTCQGTKEFFFNIGGCDNPNARYFVIVDLPGKLHLNQQIEVSIRQNAITTSATRFDHYSTAGDIGVIVADSMLTGPIDNFTCATQASVYPHTMPVCATKTLWYKFTVPANLSGIINIKSLLNGINNNAYTNSTTSMYLFKELIPGDSTINGLSRLTLSRVTINNESWQTSCVSPGVYYILYSGCDRYNDNIQPQIKLNSISGDFCATATSIAINGVGTGSSTVSIDCHSIGSDFGEYNSTLTCPNNAVTSSYKSTWFKVDITGNDTVDVTTLIIANTNVNAGLIHYRMMTGDCNAMQEQSCVTDALTQNTYECMIPGHSYYFQVFSPINAKGTLTFNVNARGRVGNCSPLNNCLKNANFSYIYDCTVNDSVIFNNNSTFGTYIQYLWDFDYNNQTSTDVNPKFKYPATNSTVIYQVKLRVVNTFCNDTAYYSLPVSIGPRPSVNLGRDTIICGQTNYILQAPSFNGVNYIWNDNSTNSSLNVTTSGLYYVSLDYNGCEASDSIRINLSSLVKNNTSNLVLCTDTSNFTLNATRNLNNVSYRWNTSDTASSIFVMNPGIYWVDIYHDSCSVRDSFIVTNFNNNISVLGNDSLICNLQGSYTLNATLPGATSYLWNTNATTPSINVNSSGIYSVNIQVGNCILQDTVNIIIARDTTIHYYDTLCYGDTFLRSNSQLVTTSGVYVDSFSTVAGCDSLIINHIQFRNLNEQIFNHVICDNQLPYIWNNLILDSAGIYTVTRTDRYGCDSISKLNLTINPSYLDSVKVVVCSNTLPFNFNNRLLTVSGIYYDTLSSIYSCDSIIRLDFVVNQSTIDTIRDTICYNQTYTLPSSIVVNAAGTYIDSFVNLFGCDSIIYTELYVFPNKSITLNDSICNNQVPYVWNGQNLSSSGIYTYTRMDMNGCDSVTTLNLVVSDAYSRTLYDTICASALPYIFNNRSLQTSGTYVDSFVSISGCDSTITLNLLVNPIYRDTVFDTICYNQTYTLPSNLVVNSSGTYTSVLRSINNCDSIIYTQLYVHSNKSNTLVDSICRNQIPYIWNGQNLSSSGIYTHTSIDINGCDSVTTLNLVVSDVYSSTLYDTICASALPYIFNNRSLQTSGIYVDSFVSIAGCDSIITLNLLVNPIYVDTIFDTICYSQTYTLPSNLMVNSSGIYTSVLTSVNNCDSIVVVNLYVHPNKSTTLIDTICSNQVPYIWNGQNLSLSGIYTYTSIDVNGCDSITSLQLLVHPNITTNISQSICIEDLPYVFNGQNLFIPGIYRDTLTDRNGCDSFVILNFSVLPNSRDTIRIEKCYGDQYWFVDTMISTTGIFTKYLTNVHGCDSVLVLDITIHPRTPLPLVATPIGYCEGATALAVSATGQNLTWYDAIQGGNVLSRAPIPNTNIVGVTTYYVSQRINNCESDRAAIQIFVSPKPKIVLNAQSVICNNDSVLVTVNGANNRTLEYRWNFNGGSSRQVTNESYIVKWSSYGPKHIWVVPIDNGCVGDTAHITIDVKQSPLQPTFEVPSVVCQGEMIVAYAPKLYNAEYEWSVDDVPYGNHDTIRINTQTRAGNYKIRLVSKIEHCYSDPIEKEVFVSALPDATIDTDETIVCINDTFYLNARSNLSDLQYIWHSNNVFLDNSENTPNAIVIMKYTEPVYLTVKNEYECAVTDSILLPTQHCCDLWVPNAFSPNGDGLNDEYRIYAKTNQKIKDFSIYDRYGKRVFYSVNQNVVWNGLVNGKKADLNVYYYIIQYICSDGKEYTLKGDITLIN